MNSQESKTLFDVAHEALKDAYVHSRPNTQVNRIIEEALNRLHNMPAELVDKERVVLLEAEISTLREHLAEVNRLLSLNCREIERLRASTPRLVEPRSAIDKPRHVAMSGICMPGCPACAEAKDSRAEGKSGSQS